MTPLLDLLKKGNFFFICKIFNQVQHWEVVSQFLLVFFLNWRYFEFQGVKNVYESESHSVVSNSLRPHELYTSWNSPGLKTGVGNLSLLQRIFPTQGLSPGLPHCRQILYRLSHKGSPKYWNGQPIPSPADLSNPGIELASPSLQADSLPTEISGKPKSVYRLLNVSQNKVEDITFGTVTRFLLATQGCSQLWSLRLNRDLASWELYSIDCLQVPALEIKLNRSK